MIKKLVVLYLLIFSLQSAASVLMGTTISRIMLDREYGLILFIDADGNVRRPSDHCHSNETWDFVLSIEDEIGKQMHQQILLALENKKFMKLVGSNNCNLSRGIEELKRVEVY